MKMPHAVSVRMLVLGALVVLGCSQGDSPTSPDALPPQFSISDGGQGDLALSANPGLDQRRTP